MKYFSSVHWYSLLHGIAASKTPQTHAVLMPMPTNPNSPSINNFYSPRIDVRTSTFPRPPFCRQYTQKLYFWSSKASATWFQKWDLKYTESLIHSPQFTFTLASTTMASTSTQRVPLRLLRSQWRCRSDRVSHRERPSNSLWERLILLSYTITTRRSNRNSFTDREAREMEMSVCTLQSWLWQIFRD
jgi:hypothetical protein